MKEFVVETYAVLGAIVIRADFIVVMPNGTLTLYIKDGNELRGVAAFTAGEWRKVLERCVE